MDSRARCKHAEPIFLVRATIDKMIERRFGPIVNITSASVKSPGSSPTLGVSVGVRAGLTGFMGVLARQVAHHNVTINGALPGRIETDRLLSITEFESKQSGKLLEEIHARHQAIIPAKRYGTVEEFAAATAFLCSAHAGYITAQNLKLDGGTFPGFA